MFTKKYPKSTQKTHFNPQKPHFNPLYSRTSSDSIRTNRPSQILRHLRERIPHKQRRTPPRPHPLAPKILHRIHKVIVQIPRIMRNQPLSKRMQKFRILQRAVFIQCLHEKFIDWLGLHEWAEQSEGFLGGAARFVVVVGEVDDEADEVGLDLVVEEGLAGAVAKAVHRAEESNGGAANVGIRLEGKTGG